MKWVVLVFGCLPLLVSLALAGEDEFYLEQGDSYFAQGFYDEAIIQYQRALQLNPDNTRAYYRMGLAYSEKGDFEKSIDYYQNAVKCNPEDAQSYYTLGVVHEDIGEMEKAIECFQKAVEINPRYTEAYHSLGNVYGKKGDYYKEMKYLKKALQLNPGNTDVYFVSMIPHGRKILYDKAKAYYQKAIQLNPYYIEAYYRLGGLYARLSEIYAYEINLDNAIRCWLKLIQLNPNDANVFYRIAFYFRLRGRDDEAERYFQKAVQRRCDRIYESEAYYHLGEIATERHNYDSAMNYCQKAIAITSDNIQAHYLLGKIYAYKGNRAKALEQVNNLHLLGKVDLAERLEQFINFHSNLRN